MADIDKYQDYLDSRDIQERIDELTTEIKDYKKDVKNGTGAEIVLEEMQHDLQAMLDLKKDYVDSFGEDSWGFGAQFIRDSYFRDYAEELADDIGAIDTKQNWPNMHIDWEAAAEELQMDYTQFVYDGVDYWAREA